MLASAGCYLFMGFIVLASLLSIVSGELPMALLGCADPF